MESQGYVLAIDQGTTSTRVLVINHNLEVVDFAQKDFAQISLQVGWMEHDPEEIWQSVVYCLDQVCERNKLTKDNVKSIGITN